MAAVVKHCQDLAHVWKISVLHHLSSVTVVKAIATTMRHKLVSGW